MPGIVASVLILQPASDRRNQEEKSVDNYTRVIYPEVSQDIQRNITSFHTSCIKTLFKFAKANNKIVLTGAKTMLTIELTMGDINKMKRF